MSEVTNRERLQCPSGPIVSPVSVPAPGVLNPTLDAVDRGCHRHLGRRCPRPPRRFVGVITTTIKQSPTSSGRGVGEHRSCADS